MWASTPYTYFLFYYTTVGDDAFHRPLSEHQINQFPVSSNGASNCPENKRIHAAISTLQIPRKNIFF